MQRDLFRHEVAGGCLASCRPALRWYAAYQQPCQRCAVCSGGVSLLVGATERRHERLTAPRRNRQQAREATEAWAQAVYGQQVA